jgi:hypothetical protein
MKRQQTRQPTNQKLQRNIIIYDIMKSDRMASKHWTSKLAENKLGAMSKRWTQKWSTIVQKGVRGTQYIIVNKRGISYLQCCVGKLGCISAGAYPLTECRVFGINLVPFSFRWRQLVFHSVEFPFEHSILFLNWSNYIYQEYISYVYSRINKPIINIELLIQPLSPLISIPKVTQV